MGNPAVYYIQKSKSVMWVWKGSEDEAHNFIHVKSPDSDLSLSPGVDEGGGVGS